uniref:Arginine/serine-rich coiled-coil protein 2 n=1 Tax=Heterorhabditis bacteriophora TaxID=37862 RepID=A0A1I7WZU1_HETBA
MSNNKDIGWMYEGPKSLVNREDYLLGKKKYSDAVNEQKPEALDALLHTRKKKEKRKNECDSKKRKEKTHESSPDSSVASVKHEPSHSSKKYDHDYHPRRSRRSRSPKEDRSEFSSNSKQRSERTLQDTLDSQSKESQHTKGEKRKAGKFEGFGLVGSCFVAEVIKIDIDAILLLLTVTFKVYRFLVLWKFCLEIVKTLLEYLVIYLLFLCFRIFIMHSLIYLVSMTSAILSADASDWKTGEDDLATCQNSILNTIINEDLKLFDAKKQYARCDNRVRLLEHGCPESYIEDPQTTLEIEKINLHFLLYAFHCITHRMSFSYF